MPSRPTTALTLADLVVLSMLAERAMHGYEIWAELEPRMIFPGHWDPVMEASAKITEYREHRLARERQVLDEVRRRPGTAAELTRRIYLGEVGESEPLLRAAEMTLRAHLRKLVEEGRVGERDGVYAAIG